MGVMFKWELIERVKSYGSSAPVIPSFYMSVCHLAPEIWQVTSVTIHTESNKHCVTSSGPQLWRFRYEVVLNIFEQKDHSLPKWIITILFVEKPLLHWFCEKVVCVVYQVPGFSCQISGVGCWNVGTRNVWK